MISTDRRTPAKPGPRRLAVGLGLLLVIACWAPAAIAEEANLSRLSAGEIAAQLDAARVAKDKRLVERLAGVVAAAHNRCRSRVICQRLQRSLSSLLSAKALGASRIYVADALGDLNDAQAAWKVLRPSMPSARDQAVGVLGLRVLRAVGLAASDLSWRDLLAFVRTGRDPNAVKYAVEALGHFNLSKKRTKILESLLDIETGLAGRARPARDQDADQVRRAWNDVSASFVDCFNKLTGRRLADMQSWKDLHRTHRRTPSKLFKVPLSSELR